MPKATRDDVDLILRLYDMRRETTLRKARQFMAQEFYSTGLKEFNEKYPPGSEKNAWYRQTLSYWDMVGVFVNKGLLDAELLFETTSEFHIYWVKARATVMEMRQARNMPMYLKNLEDLTERHSAFVESRSPGALSFYASMNKPPAGS
jgi:hypothetical protein